MDTAAPVPKRRSPLPALRAGLISAGAGVVGSLVTFVAATLGGADLQVTLPGAPAPMPVGPINIIAFILGIVALGTVALMLAARFWPRGWMVLAWLGLAIGLISVVSPLTVDASTATKAALAVMHVLVGASWWVTLFRLRPGS